MFVKRFNFFTTKVQETGHRPRPAALDDLVGSSSDFCVCVPYVCIVYLHKCLKISPKGTNPPYNAFFKLNTTN